MSSQLANSISCITIYMGFIDMSIRKRAFLIILPLLFLAACAGASPAEPPLAHIGQRTGHVEQQPEYALPINEGAISSAHGPDDENAWRIRITVPSGEEIWSFTEAELNALLHEQIVAFSHVFSTINNWPAARFYAAGGFSIESILKTAGVLETAQTVIFRAADGYEASLTREQLLSAQYFYPQVGEDAQGAEPVMPIIAYRLREGTTDINELREDKPTLIFGQRSPFEHTNPAFVVGVTEIIIDDALCEQWEAASTFPMPGLLAEGEMVKLQHRYYGLVKLHYTLDGSDPTPLSAMYNPSTYQPELNVPITITEPVTIKVLVTGFGKNDSEIAIFNFSPAAS